MSWPHTGISAVQHTCERSCIGDVGPASGTRLSFAVADGKGGGGCHGWAASKRCDGILLWRIGLEKVMAGTRVFVFATR